MARPGSAGRFLRTSVNDSRPPAEAPTPTTGNGGPAGGASGGCASSGREAGAGGCSGGSCGDIGRSSGRTARLARRDTGDVFLPVQVLSPLGGGCGPRPARRTRATGRGRGGRGAEPPP